MNKKEEKIRKILEKYSDDAWYDGRIWDGVDDGIIRAMLEFGEECFNAALENKKFYNPEKDGSLTMITIIPEYKTFENYLNSLE